MTCNLGRAAQALAVWCAFAAPVPVAAQTGDPDAAPVQVEWLALSPALRLTNVGWDDNVFHVSKTEAPTRDFMATFSPATEFWIRLPRARIQGRSELDFVYFKELSHIRSIDNDHAARAELPLGRVLPYAGGSWASTRHRWNFEIDTPARRVDSSVDGGVDVRFSPKTSIGVTAQRSGVEYKGETEFQGTVLARQLNGRTTAQGVKLRYALTPLTTVGFDARRYQNDFSMVPERNSKGTRIASVVELKPTALISGRAELGVVSRRFVDGTVPRFRGMLARVDLSYTLLGRTRFNFDVQRDLSASYRAEHRDYLQTGVQLSVTHRLTNLWDVRGTVQRFRLEYGLRDGPGPEDGAGPAVESVGGYGIEIGYLVSTARVAFAVERQARRSDFSGRRDYERTRVISSLTYGF